MYIKIKGDTRTIVSHPGWLDDDGNTVSNATLAEHGYFRVVDVPPEYNSDTHTMGQDDIYGWEQEGDTFIVSYTLTEMPLETIRENQLAKINAAFSAQVETFMSGYPMEERLTWPVQEKEALAWEADSSAPTPYLDGIASVRGISPEEMRQLTINQVNNFRSMSQQAVGKRQRLRDALFEATTAEEILAITWEGANE